MGLRGPSLDQEQRRFIREAQPAGFILFARNIEGAEQVAELNRELVDLCPADRPPLLSLDQEGGRVLRLKATPWPSMRVLGNADNLGLTGQVARAMSDELRATGFNLNFAPVCDVDSNPKNPVIGDRSFGPSPAQVSRHALAFMEGAHSRGVIACAKHFPGHGDTSVDSHLALPIVDKELGELREVELPPFAAMVKAGVGMVMTSHVVFPDLDRDLPCTLSEKVLKRLLRDELGFRGVVISDDLEMKAVRGRWAVPDVLELATRAGVDLFCVGRSFEPELTLSGEVYEGLVRLSELSRGLETMTEDSVKRLWALRLRFLLRPPAAADRSVVGCPGFKALAESARQLGGGAGLA